MPTDIRRTSFKIVLRRVEKPFSDNLEDELNWICQSFGFFGPVETNEKTAASVFKEIVNASEKGKPHTSTSLATTLKISRGSAINHINNLLRAGLISKEGRYYLPRSRSMFRTIKEVEEDMLRIFREMEKTAREIDKAFGIEIKE